MLLLDKPRGSCFVPHWPDCPQCYHTVHVESVDTLHPLLGFAMPSTTPASFLLEAQVLGQQPREAAQQKAVMLISTLFVTVTLIMVMRFNSLCKPMKCECQRKPFR